VDGGGKVTNGDVIFPAPKMPIPVPPLDSPAGPRYPPPMSAPLTLSHTHEAIARWMVMNPKATLRDIAAEFGYSANYISLLRGTDAFQEKLRELNNAADGMVIADLPARMRATANVALEKLGEAVEEAMTTGTGGVRDREFLRETTDMLLHRLGYAPKRDVGPVMSTPPPMTAVILADKEVVSGAVQKLMERFEPPPPAPELKLVEAEPEAEPVDQERPYG
jgi:hypothetical protein